MFSEIQTRALIEQLLFLPLSPRPGLLAVIILCRFRCDTSMRVNMTPSFLEDVSKLGGKIALMGMLPAIEMYLNGNSQHQLHNTVTSAIDPQVLRLSEDQLKTLTGDVELAVKTLSTLDTDSNQRVTFKKITGAISGLWR